MPGPYSSILIWHHVGNKLKYLKFCQIFEMIQRVGTMNYHTGDIEYTVVLIAVSPLQGFEKEKNSNSYLEGHNNRFLCHYVLCLKLNKSALSSMSLGNFFC